jgi:hypothetical protein
MNSLRDSILNHLSRYDLKEEVGGQYRCNSPLRAGANSHSFTVRFDAEDQGVWYDHVEGEGGSLFDLARRLDIPLPERQPIESSKRAYAGIDEYARFKGVPVSAFVLAGWQEEVLQKDGRAALKFKTKSGDRWRFLDGENPKFKSTYGYTACWYGLDRAVQIATQTQQPVVIVNGEPSVVVAQHYGLAACCITGGEAKNIPAGLAEEFKSKWGGTVYIALDCDEAGVKGARKYLTVIPHAIALDLGLDKGGDVADVCKLHTDESLNYLKRCKVLFANSAPVPETKRYISGREMHEAYQRAILGEAASSLKPILNPLTFLHRHGGFGKYWIPGKLAYYASVSGGTKTIGFESMIDALKAQGIYSIIYTPEWVDGADSIEMAAREVQRKGGLAFETTLDLFYWQQAHEGERPATTEQIAASAARSKYAASAKGDAFFLTGKGLSVQAMCEDITYCCMEETAKGHKPSVLFIDFAQLLWLEDDNKQRVWMETAMGLVKDCCSQNGLFGNVSSQMNKASAEYAKDGKVMDSGMMQWLSEQQANFVMAFAPKLDASGQREWFKNGDGDVIHKMRGQILKNSMSSLQNTEFRFGVDFKHLLWVGEENN